MKTYSSLQRLFCQKAKLILIEKNLKAELNYEDILGVNQYKGGEFAMRMATMLHDKIVQKMEDFRQEVVNTVCPAYCDAKRSGKIRAKH